MSNGHLGSPIFICGYPKSGTTLLLALLDRHPELLVFPEETKFFKLVMGRPDRCNPEYVLTQTGTKNLGVGEFRYTSGYRDYSNLDFSAYRHCLQVRWANSDRSERSLLEAMISCYAQITEQISRKYWVEKTPLNEKYLSKVITWWPDLRAIYIVRDPRDNYCSYRKLRDRRFKTLQQKELQDSKGQNAPTSTRTNRSSSLPLSLDEFVAYWLESVQIWDRFAAQNPKSLIIRYEDLVQNPDVELQRLCTFLGIDWDNILKQPTRNGVLWSGNSMYDVAFSGISTESMGRYRELLTSDEIHFLNVWLRHAITRYSFPLDDEMTRRRWLIKDILMNRESKLYIKMKMAFGYLNSQRKRGTEYA